MESLRAENKTLRQKLQEGRIRVQELTRKVGLLQFSFVASYPAKNQEGEKSQVGNFPYRIL